MLRPAIFIMLAWLSTAGASHAQTTVNVDSLGAMGDGVTWDHDAIQTAINTAGLGGTIVFTHGKTYATCKQLTVFEGQRIVGNGATIRRCDQVATTLAAPAAEGASQISVTDASVFEEDLAIVVFSGPANTNGEAANIHRIESIAGPTITFSGVLQRTYPAGSTVAVLDDMIKATGFDIRIEGLVIDGNRRNNEGWIAWQRGTSVVTTGGDIRIVNNLFIDCWSNCLKPFSTNILQITGNVFDSVAAAVIHFSSTDSLLFENNRILHTNHSPHVGHSEAALTWSALNRNFTVRNNCIYDSGAGAFGSINLKHNRNMTIEQNLVCESEGLFSARLQEAPTAGYEDHGRMIFRNNVGVNVKGSTVSTFAGPFSLDDLVFEDNTIVNGFIEFAGLERGSIRGNDIVMLDWATYGDDGGSFASQSGLITLLKPLRTVIADNRLVGGEKGIYIRNIHDVSADSVVITGNDVVDFTRTGVATASLDRLTGLDYQSDNTGILVQSNTVISDLLDEPDDAGIRTASGAQVLENCSETNRVGAEVNGTFADSAAGAPSTLYLKNVLAGDSAAISFLSAAFVSDVQFDTNTVSSAIPPEYAAAAGSVLQGNVIDSGAMCTLSSPPPIPSCTICEGGMPELDGVFVDVRILLQGAFAGSGQMDVAASFQKSLHDSATAHPYGSPPFIGTPAEYHGTEFVSPALPDGVIDWVVVALRSGPNAGDEVGRVAGLLMDDASVRSLDGTLEVFFPGVSKTSYYVVVHHRNHLAVMSSSPVGFASGHGSWDFRTGQNQAYSDTGPGMKDLGDGWFGMFTGDTSADGMVTASDFNDFLAATKAALTGYRIEDFNLDDQVTAADFNLWLANTKAAAATQIP